MVCVVFTERHENTGEEMHQREGGRYSIMKTSINRSLLIGMIFSMGACLQPPIDEYLGGVIGHTIEEKIAALKVINSHYKKYRADPPGFLKGKGQEWINHHYQDITYTETQKADGTYIFETINQVSPNCKIHFLPIKTASSRLLKS